MSLIGALNIGQSAMAVASASIQVTGNNIANASDPNYSREVTGLAPSVEVQDGSNIYLGTGVTVENVTRQIDQSLQSSLNTANSNAAAATTTQQWLTQVQSTFNELNGQGLSTTMTNFFNSWSSLANSPQDTGQRQVVIQDGQNVAQQFQSIRSQLLSLQNNANSQITALAGTADNLATQIASLNGQIVTAQGGSGAAPNALLDQRDAAISQLSQLINVQTVPQSNGSVNVYVGSDPLVMATQSQGITVQQTASNGQVTSNLAFKTNGGTINATSGQLGALIGTQQQISTVVSQFDTLAGNLADAVNKVYSSGQGLQGFSSVTATNAVSNAGAALDQPAAGLQFAPTNGSFVVHVQDPSGQQTSTLVPVTLGQGTNGTSLNSLAASLNSVPGVTATIQGGQLSINAASGQTITFSQDSSGVLAALGINTFFTGSNASNLSVNSTLQGHPELLAAAQNGQTDDNQTAVALAALQTQSLPAQGDLSLAGNYQAIINGIANNVATAQTNSDAATNVQQTLKAQQQSVSGVSVNEEAVNLIQQQQAFQGAARLISVLDTMMTTLMNIT